MKFEPHFVTFEQAILLFYKKFDAPCLNMYSPRKEVLNVHFMIWEDLICNSKIEEYLQTRKKLQFENPGSDYSPEYVCTAPEQWQVIDWLLKTYNLWIRVDHFVSNDGMVTWDYEIDKTGVGVHDPSYQRLVEFQEDRGFATPQEAYSEAITYILENLI